MKYISQSRNLKRQQLLVIKPTHKLIEAYLHFLDFAFNSIPFACASRTLCRMAPVFAAFLLLGNHAFAATLLVPTQYPTIQAAVDNASAGDIIVVAPGEYGESVNLRGKSIVLRSEIDLGAQIIAPPNSRSIVATSGEPSTTRVVGFDLRRGSSVGGGVIVENASLTIESCMFRESANVGGGAALVTGGAVSFLRCQFMDCKATGTLGTFGAAGGLQARGGSTQIDDCSFIRCDSGGAADAILHDLGGSVVVRRCLFQGGGTQPNFGVNYNAQGSMTVEDSTFDGVTKPAMFGWSPYSVVRCTFKNMQTNCILDRRNGDYVVSECQIRNCATNASLFTSTYSGSYRIQNTTACATSWIGGVANGTLVDLGGNSFGGDCVDCTGDMNANSIIDGADLGILLAFWGPVTTFPRADINQDGLVNGADLGTLLSLWGPCPN
jgi:hypothetical protein